MKHFKRIIALALAMLMVFACFAACGNGKTTDDKDDKKASYEKKDKDESEISSDETTAKAETTSENKTDTVTSLTEVWTGDNSYTKPVYKPVQNSGSQGNTDTSSLDKFLKNWYGTGTVMDQENVTNVLLLGIDGKNGVSKGGNADSMILVSINRDTQKITLVSFMRDSRTYYSINGKDYWAKINSSFSRGGAEATVNAIEHNYKIDIDYYAVADFSTFPDLVDALGGVTVNMQEYEQKYINRTTTQIEKIPNSGEVTLDGDQALVYCRIRKCDADGDVSRTRRQRNFVSALIKSVQGASPEQLIDAMKTVLPHLVTNCGMTEMLGFANQAAEQGWMNYEIVQLTMPYNGTRKDAYINNIFYLIVDFPLAAQKVQQTIYGTTNITLDSNRENALDYVK